MPTTNDLLETINDIALTGSYTSYTPESWTTSSVTTPLCSTTFTPNAIYMSNQSIDDTIKEATEKVDKHVDQLEEDIEFFNKEREEHAKAIAHLLNDSLKKDKDIADLQMKVNGLETILIDMRNLLKELEEKVNDDVN